MSSTRRVNRLIITVSALMGGTPFTPLQANMPVIDWGNWAQNIQMIALQQQQYDNLLTNTRSLTSWQWDDASQMMNTLLNNIDTIDTYKQEAGGLNNWLARYQSEEDYRRSPCFTGNCTAGEYARLNDNQRAGTRAQKQSVDAMIRGLDAQQQTLKADAARLRLLQQQAQNAEGQKQAISAASLLASAEVNQLLQIRGLLLAAQTAQATEALARANQEALIAAGDAHFKSGTYHKSAERSW